MNRSPPSHRKGIRIGRNNLCKDKRGPGKRFYFSQEVEVLLGQGVEGERER